MAVKAVGGIGVKRIGEDGPVERRRWRQLGGAGRDSLVEGNKANVSEGGNGGFAVGQVVERFPRVPAASRPVQ